MLRKMSQTAMLSLMFTAPSFAGVYIGASVGPEGASFSQKSHVVGQNSHQPQGVFNVYATNHFSGIGVFGSLFGGYAWSSQRYYLAGEINGNLSSVKYKLTNDELIHQNFAKTTFTIKSSEGVSLLPGFFFSDNTLFYARVGYANGHVKLAEGADPSIQSMTKNLSGCRYGVGVRHSLTAQWSLMMDYSQINYGHLTSHTFDPIGGVTKDTKITPSTAQLALGAIYSFDRPAVYTK
ncbi:MAG: outer membrane protein [Legionellales bacterium]